MANNPERPQPEALPPFLGGENPWHWLSPEGEQQASELNEAQQHERAEMAAHFARCFSTPSGREVLAFLERQVQSQSRFWFGITMEQATAVMVWSQGQQDLINFIKEQKRRAENA